MGFDKKPRLAEDCWKLVTRVVLLAVLVAVKLGFVQVVLMVMQKPKDLPPSPLLVALRWELSLPDVWVEHSLIG